MQEVESANAIINTISTNGYYILDGYNRSYKQFKKIK